MMHQNAAVNFIFFKENNSVKPLAHTFHEINWRFSFAQSLLSRGKIVHDDIAQIPYGKSHTGLLMRSHFNKSQAVYYYNMN